MPARAYFYPMLVEKLGIFERKGCRSLVSTRKIRRHGGPGLIESLKKAIGTKDWLNAWLRLVYDALGWCYIMQVFWNKK